MHSAQVRTYGLLIHRCRRFFPPGSDAAIWHAWWPALPQLFQPQSFEVRSQQPLLCPPCSYACLTGTVWSGLGAPLCTLCTGLLAVRRVLTCW